MDGPPEETFQKVTFKKAGRLAKHTNRRQRGAQPQETAKNPSDEDHASSSEDDTAVVLRGQRRKKNPLIQATSGAKRLRPNEQQSSSSDGDEIKERDNLLATPYEANKNANRTGPQDMGACAVNEMDTEIEKDAQTQFESTQKAIEETRGKEDDRKYRGLAAYDRYKKVEDSAAGNASSGFVRKGPIRAPNFLRMSVRWDYAPDLCKDYKETGFCTFGDSCKFLHDRTDYKHGWELERDWQQGKKEEDADKYVISDDEDQLPFKCYLCRESFTNPVVTKCDHYFCEKCAIENYKQCQKCYVCGKNTQGVFNPAKAILARMAGESKPKSKGRHNSASEESEEDNDEDNADKPDTQMQMLDEANASEEGEETEGNPPKLHIPG